MYLDDIRKVSWEVKDHAHRVLAHPKSLDGTLHLRRETSLKDFPKIADVADFTVAIEMVGSKTLSQQERCMYVCIEV